MNEKSLSQLLAWSDKINAKSSPEDKAHQRHLVSEMLRSFTMSEERDSPPMTVSAPNSFSIKTTLGAISRRHFIGGEEVRLADISIQSRTYKVVATFEPAYASDIATIGIPLREALEVVSGFEIRLLSVGVDELAINIGSSIAEAVQAKQVVKSSQEYANIGYGSW